MTDCFQPSSNVDGEYLRGFTRVLVLYLFVSPQAIPGIKKCAQV